MGSPAAPAWQRACLRRSEPGQQKTEDSAVRGVLCGLMDSTPGARKLSLRPDANSASSQCQWAAIAPLPPAGRSDTRSQVVDAEADGVVLPGWPWRADGAEHGDGDPVPLAPQLQLPRPAQDRVDQRGRAEGRTQPGRIPQDP